jgi:hypothetical protein
MICRNHVDVAEGVRRCSRCGGSYCSDCLVTMQDALFCAGCKTEQLLDVRSASTACDLPARFWPRFAAQFIDGLIVTIASFAVAGAIAVVVMLAARQARRRACSSGRDIQMYVFRRVRSADALRETRTDFGKMALHVRVVRPDGRITSDRRAAPRFAPPSASPAWHHRLPAYFFTDERTTLHDMVAGTRRV